MEDPDELTLKDIRRWYQEHGMPYEHEDWGPRGENGESARPQHQTPEETYTESRTRAAGTGGERPRANPLDPSMWDLLDAGQHPLWGEQRTEYEVQSMLRLEEFFAPYIAMLPRPKGNLVRQAVNDGLTYQEIADEAGMANRSVAHKAVQRAMRDLTKLIARDDPQYTPPEDGRKRDYDAERKAARHVFKSYMIRKGYGG